MLCLEPIDSGSAQNKTGDAIGATAQEENFLDLRGDVPNPRRIAASELHKLPRAETRTTDPNGKIVRLLSSGHLVEVLLHVVG
jgi:hypothetical protein